VHHLYIHIPFCHRICPYCSFYKHTPGATPMGEFVEAVLTEAKRQRARYELDLRTVYLGGGTPTALSETHLERLLSGLRETLDLSKVKEFTCEVNPRTVTESKAAMMRAQGIDRISLGIQAWDEATLKTLGRDHAPADAEETYHLLRGAGFRSVNVDLMFSIPGQTLETWLKTVQHTISLGPDHISAYNLNYEEDTEFFERLHRGQYREDQSQDAEFFDGALQLLQGAGYEHYEISNYAKPGHRSAHNESYWLGEDYLGLGPSAFSTRLNHRWQNVPDTARYLEIMAANEEPALPGEHLTVDQRRTERFGLELRTERGLPYALVREPEQRMVGILQAEGLLEVKDDHIRLTRVGKPLVDSVAVALLGDGE
jgi:oxygen-independent coproporphyrinogen III oxidase